MLNNVNVYNTKFKLLKIAPHDFILFEHILQHVLKPIFFILLFNVAFIVIERLQIQMSAPNFK